MKFQSVSYDARNIHKRCHERSNPEPYILVHLLFDRHLQHDHYVSRVKPTVVPRGNESYLCDMPMTLPLKVCFAKQRAVLRNEISTVDCSLEEPTWPLISQCFIRCDKRGEKKRRRLHT